jgi:MFS family permease
MISPPSARRALAALSLSMLLSSLGTSIANVGLPAFAQAFGASFQAVQWIVLSYLLAVTTLIVGVGRLGDLIGRRRLLLAGLLLFSGASALSGVAPALWLLIAARAAQGLGAAVMMALAMAFVAETVPKARMGSAMGLLGTMSAIGTALGPPLGGLLIAGPGWRAIFLVNLPLGLLAFCLAYRHLPADRPRPSRDRTGFDAIGTLLLALTLAAYALAMTIDIVLLAAAACGGALFVRVQARARSPLVRLAMFHDRALRAGLAMSALVATVMMATLVVGPFYLSRGLGLDAALVGLVLSAGPLAAALAGVPAGHAADRFGAPRMTLAGLFVMAVGCVILATMPAALGIRGYLAPIVLITAGYALFQTANNSAVMADVRADQSGIVSGLLNLSRNLGLITGASAMGAVFAAASAAGVTAAAPEAIAAGMRITFAVAALLTVAAIAIAALGSRRHRDERPALVDDIGGELGGAFGAGVGHRVDRPGRDEQDVAGPERHRRPAVEAIFERAPQHIDQLFARMAVPGGGGARGEIDADLDRLVPGGAEVVAQQVGARDGRLLRRRRLRTAGGPRQSDGRSQ